MNKHILIYRYNSICEPAIIRAFTKLGCQIDAITAEMTNKNITPTECLKLVSDQLILKNYDAVFTINFYPVISEVCTIFKIPYICLTVDCPIMELYSDSIMNKYNRIFLFDYAQYQEFSSRNPKCIFYMPLAADVEQYDTIVDTIHLSKGNIQTSLNDAAPLNDLCDSADNHYVSNDESDNSDNRFISDISFVGSLYSEKCSYNNSKKLPDYLRGYLEGIMEAQLKVYGYNFLPELITENIATEYGKYGKMYHFPEKSDHNNISSLAHNVLGYKIAELERKRLLRLLSENFSVDLYTGSDTKCLPKIHNKGTVNTLTEMPKVFHLSKINLNFTIKPIQTGLPLRIWDILGCGGFVLTNYQSEISEYFEVGKEIEIFGSENELIEKVDYYLNHEEERIEIAKNGYEKVKKFHTWNNRCEQILSIVFS